MKVFLLIKKQKYFSQVAYLCDGHQKRKQIEDDTDILEKTFGIKLCGNLNFGTLYHSFGQCLLMFLPNGGGQQLYFWLVEAFAQKIRSI